MTQLSYHVANAFPGRDGLSALIFGIAFLFVALAMPEGISGTWAKITKRVRRPPRADAGLLTARTKI
jgi:ABC-type branched-subunit amino acid transport system permease subunit